MKTRVLSLILLCSFFAGQLAIAQSVLTSDYFYNNFDGTTIDDANQVTSTNVSLLQSDNMLQINDANGISPSSRYFLTTLNSTLDLSQDDSHKKVSIKFTIGENYPDSVRLSFRLWDQQGDRSYKDANYAPGEEYELVLDYTTEIDGIVKGGSGDGIIDFSKIHRFEIRPGLSNGSGSFSLDYLKIGDDGILSYLEISEKTPELVYANNNILVVPSIWKSENCNVNVYRLTGEKYITSKGDQQLIKLEPGIYIVKLSMFGKSLVQKVISN